MSTGIRSITHLSSHLNRRRNPLAPPAIKPVVAITKSEQSNAIRGKPFTNYLNTKKSQSITCKFLRIPIILVIKKEWCNSPSSYRLAHKVCRSNQEWALLQQLRKTINNCQPTEIFIQEKFLLPLPVTIEGRTIANGTWARSFSRICSASDFEKVYVFGLDGPSNLSSFVEISRKEYELKPFF